MKKRFSALLGCLVVFLPVLSVAALVCAEESKASFLLVNKSGQAFAEIWAGPSSNLKWTAKDKVMTISEASSRPSSHYYINLDGRKNIRYWDIRVVTADGKKHEWHNFDLFTIRVVEIDQNFKAHSYDVPVSSEPLDLRFKLKNDSGVTFSTIWLKPSHVSKWDPDTDMLKHEYYGYVYAA